MEVGKKSIKLDKLKGQSPLMNGPASQANIRRAAARKDIDRSSLF